MFFVSLAAVSFMLVRNSVKEEIAGVNSVSWTSGAFAPYKHSSYAIHWLLLRLESNVSSASATPWSWRMSLRAGPEPRPSASRLSMVSNRPMGSGMAAAEATRTRMSVHMVMSVSDGS